MIGRPQAYVVLCGASLALACAGCASLAEREAFEAAARVERAMAGREEAPGPSAATAADLPGEPSLADYLGLAARRNPGVQAAWHRWKAALERVPQARTLPDPALEYELEALRRSQMQTVRVRQMLPGPGKLDLEAAVALEEAHAARLAYEAEKVRLDYRVKEAYYEYYYISRTVEVVRGMRDLVKYLEEVARTRYRTATASHPDVIRAQVELGKLDDRLRTQEAEGAPAAARLNAAMDRPTDAPLPWPKAAPQEPLRASDDRVLAWMREASPDLAMLEREAAARERAVERARLDFHPDFMVGLGYLREQMSGDADRSGVMAMVGVTLPVWREKYAAAVREAEARREAVLKQRADLANMLAADVRMALFRLRDAGRKIDLYHRALVPKAEEALKATEAAFRAGTALFTDLVDAERMLLEFQLAYERALADHAIRRAEVERLVGRALPPGEAPVPAAPGGPPAEAAPAQGDKP